MYNLDFMDIDWYICVVWNFVGVRIVIIILKVYGMKFFCLFVVWDNMKF